MATCIKLTKLRLTSSSCYSARDFTATYMTLRASLHHIAWPALGSCQKARKACSTRYSLPSCGPAALTGSEDGHVWVLASIFSICSEDKIFEISSAH